MSVDISGVSGLIAQTTSENSQAASTDNKVANLPQGGAQNRVVQDDSVRLTDSANRLQQLTASVAAMPVVDTGKVSDIQRSIGTGSFQIDPTSAADHLIQQEQELALLEVSK